MSNHWCAVCGHANSPGAEVCAMCDTRLNDAWDANANAGENTSEPGYSTYGERPRATYGEEPRSSASEIPRTRFKGVGDVFGPTLEIYRKNFLLIVILVVVTTLPETLLQYGLIKMLSYTPSDAFVYAISGSVLIWLLMLASSALLSCALVYAVMGLQTAGASSAGESLRRGLKALPKVFLIDLMFSVVVVVGYVLLIVPGVILSLMFALVVPVAIAEGRGPVDSFKRSMELTSGYKGLIFLTYFLWTLATAVIGLIVSSSFSYGGPQDALLVMLINALVTGILNSSTAVLTIFIYLGILHERRHGFDTRTFTSASGPFER
jgi:hypothetical protein